MLESGTDHSRGSQTAGDSHRLPLVSARSAVYFPSYRANKDDDDDDESITDHHLVPNYTAW